MKPSKFGNIKTSYRICYYSLMNLLMCPLLKLFIKNRNRESREDISMIEQNSMSKYLLSNKYSVTFSDNKEKMVNTMYKSSIMEWSKYCQNKGLLIIDLSCSGNDYDRPEREEDLDAISVHSQNPRGHTTKIKGISLVGGKKTKKYNYK